MQPACPAASLATRNSYVGGFCMTQTIKWAAQLSGVRDVSVVGAADLAYWTPRLEAEGLAPLVQDGRAQLTIISADGRFMGLRFRELSFSVLALYRNAGVERPGAMLVQAFNSRRSFAWFERTLFATPYLYGDVRVETDAPASIALSLDDGLRFQAEMLNGVGGAAVRTPARVGEGGWNGPVFLPTAGSAEKFFVADVSGLTETYPFDRGLDWFSLQPGQRPQILSDLIESHFTPTEWQIRKDAVHRKSKTYDRAALEPP
jgi:hypothetical protein